MCRETAPPEDLLLGFDARLVPPEAGPAWLETRREQYLLRPEIARPFSADSTVWPSVTSLIPELAPPGWVGPCAPFWDSLKRLESFLSGQPVIKDRPYTVVALTLETGLYGRADLAAWWNRRMAVPDGQGNFKYPQAATRRRLAQLLDITPARRAVGWQFLGYDVADRWLISGLSNCGYLPEEREPLRARFGLHLNEHHLFTDAGIASEFKFVSDERVKAHAPFFVHGLWLIRENRLDANDG